MAAVEELANLSQKSAHARNATKVSASILGEALLFIDWLVIKQNFVNSSSVHLRSSEAFFNSDAVAETMGIPDSNTSIASPIDLDFSSATPFMYIAFKAQVRVHPVDCFEVPSSSEKSPSMFFGSRKAASSGSPRAQCTQPRAT